MTGWPISTGSKREGLLGLNSTGWELVGSGSPGYTTALPTTDQADGLKLADLWVWMESQETTMISPAMFSRLFLPYMADVSRRFGLVYYGCCEPVHDRWDRIIAAIPNVRAVSISPWCNQRVMAEKLGRSCVFSRKPKAAPISGENPDWDTLRADVAETLAAAPRLQPGDHLPRRLPHLRRPRAPGEVGADGTLAHRELRRGKSDMKIATKDRDILRRLAEEQAEIAALPGAPGEGGTVAPAERPGAGAPAGVDQRDPLERDERGRRADAPLRRPVGAGRSSTGCAGCSTSGATCPPT